MPRPPRVRVPGGAYHVMGRAVARGPLFRDDEDRRAFLALLGQVVRRHEWLCHAYCLMTTHYHLLVRTPDGDLARGVQRLHGDYAAGRNRRHDGVGHLFAGRYSALHVEREAHLLEVCRYVALNPVRAGLCDEPADWPWSSYPFALGLARPPMFLASDWLLVHFAHERSRARARLRAFVDEGLAAGPPTRAARAA